jgi:membrane associated rhomboid family serine protease
MEIFIDGGLFELIAFLIFGYAINYVFKKKYLLIAYCTCIIITPVIIPFLHKGALLDLVIIFNIANAALLVLLLWRHYKFFKGEPLINVKKYRQKLPRFFQKKPELEINENSVSPLN